MLRTRFAADPGFPGAVREMRQRLERAEPGGQNFKTSPGAVYDIDFVACYLAIRYDLDGGCGNLRQRLAWLRERQFLDKSDWVTLDSAGELFRAVEHAVRLVVGKARKSLPATEHGSHAAERLTGRLLRRDFAGGLAAELARTFAEVRSVYERLLQ